MIKAISLPGSFGAAIMVIAGEYGTGNDRKKKLENDGFNYSEVQKCVNELLPILNKYA